MKHPFANNLILLAVISTLVMSTASVSAQQRTRHHLIDGNMVPGAAADHYRLGNPALRGHVQPVRLITPKGTNIEVGTGNSFIQTNASKASLAMQIGPVYRFKLTNVPRYEGKSLYPSIELLNRLNPPQGLENEFPVEVVLTQEDVVDAMRGSLVTKVIYLENPENALPQRHMADQQPTIDISGARDPLREAERLGRPMAILRIGSRIPLATDEVNLFNFNAPLAAQLPDPTPDPAK
ncbi:hypothetical protein N9B37_00735 [bacterium]|nr:hypothetical protein [Mariniblastus sp.]MDA7913340.1 hypothetical protein [bacterium]